MIYGISPCDESNKINIRPVMTLTAPVISIKECKEGDYIGYGQTYKIKKDTRIAALGIGYGDGVPRRLSNIGKVFFQSSLRCFNLCLWVLKYGILHMAPCSECTDPASIWLWRSPPFRSFTAFS